MDCKKLLFLIPFLLFADQSTYWNEGSSEAQSMLGTYKNNLDTRVNNPLTQNQDLYTIDNSKSAKVSIDCGEEYDIVRISYTIGSRGDVNINIQTDWNLDNSFEKSYVFNGISGVCTNGVIKCDSGTWNNCKYYQFQFNGSDLSLKEVNLENLYGCYCINGSCGNVSSNYNQVLSTLSGAITSILNHNYYIISNYKINSNTADIYGKSINCGGESVPVGMDESKLQAKADEAKSSETYMLLYETTQNEEKNSSVDESYKNNLTSKYNQVAQNSSYSSGSYSYTDGDAKVSGSFFVGDINQSKFCEIEWVAEDTQAYSDNTNKATSTSSATTKKSEIIECKKDNNGNWYCPVKEGQIIKHDCGNIDDFGEVAGVLSGINDAVKDLTCSKE